MYHKFEEPLAQFTYQLSLLERFFKIYDDETYGKIQESDLEKDLELSWDYPRDCPTPRLYSRAANDALLYFPSLSALAPRLEQEEWSFDDRESLTDLSLPKIAEVLLYEAICLRNTTPLTPSQYLLAVARTIDRIGLPQVIQCHLEYDDQIKTNIKKEKLMLHESYVRIDLDFTNRKLQWLGEEVAQWNSLLEEGKLDVNDIMTLPPSHHQYFRPSALAAARELLPQL